MRECQKGESPVNVTSHKSKSADKFFEFLALNVELNYGSQYRYSVYRDTRSLSTLIVCLFVLIVYHSISWMLYFVNALFYFLSLTVNGCCTLCTNKDIINNTAAE